MQTKRFYTEYLTEEERTIDNTFEGYDSGLTWNGYDVIYVTKDQLVECLNTLPYDFDFDSQGNCIIWDDMTKIEPFEWNGLAVYSLEGYLIEEVISC